MGVSFVNKDKSARLSEGKKKRNSRHSSRAIVPRAAVMRALRVSSVQEVNELFFRGTGEDGCLDAGALQAAVETFGYALSDDEAARAVAKLAACRISAASGMPEADGVQAATVTRSQLQCFLESVEAEWAYYPLKVVDPSAAIDILDGRLDGFSVTRDRSFGHPMIRGPEAARV